MANPILKYFTVQGNGEFPLDMLRSDQCWPATTQDAQPMTAHYCISDPQRKKPRTLRLATAEKYSPNRQRWLSFSWRVID